MEHLQQFRERRVLPLSIAAAQGWRLKRYAILAEGRGFDPDVATAASTEAFARLPDAGSLIEGAGNHGVGVQIIHFAEVAVVSPVFYWQWGSVLANIGQMRAQWDVPTAFGNGAEEVVGCVWEMEVVAFEVNAWKKSVLSGDGTPEERLARYLETFLD